MYLDATKYEMVGNAVLLIKTFPSTVRTCLYDFPIKTAQEEIKICRFCVQMDQAAH
jgi:hypothetical protein